MIKPGRLFTFGCSYTAYLWPTWADILGQQWEYFENWARPSAGNNFIFNSIIECDARNNLGPDDTILVMWTSTPRLDCYQLDKWCHIAHRFVKDDKSLPYSCPDGYEILSYPLFEAAHGFLQSKGTQFRLLNWFAFDNRSKAGTLYASTLEKIQFVKFHTPGHRVRVHHGTKAVEILYDRISGQDWPSLKKILSKNYVVTNQRIAKEIADFEMEIQSNAHYQIYREEDDFHPLPCAHLEVVSKIFPGIDIDPKTALWCTQIHEKILTHQDYQFERNYPKTRL